MDVLAFVYATTAHDDPAVLEPRSLDTLTPQLSGFAGAGMAGVMSLSVVATTPAAIAAVSLGDNGDSVSSIQTALKRAGFDPGDIDGVFGATTEDAVLQFQSDRGLDADGVVGTKTAEALGLVSHDRTTGVSSRPALSTTTTPTSLAQAGSTTGRSTSLSPSADRSESAPSRGLADDQPRLATVHTEGGILVRVNPGLDADAIDYRDNGQQVSLSGETVYKDGHTWAQLSDQAGWVATDYLTVGATATSDTETHTGRQDAVAADGERSPVRPSSLSAANSPTASEDASLSSSPVGTSTPSSVGTSALSSSNSSTSRVSPPISASPLRSRQARVTADILIVRDAPSGQDTGNTLLQGQVVQITGVRVAQGGRDWLELSNGSWVASDYLLPI